MKTKHQPPLQNTALPLAQQISEGIHQLHLQGQRLVVDVRSTMQGQWPEKHEVLMAHPLSGPPRFPWAVSELLTWGGQFTPIT